MAPATLRSPQPVTVVDDCPSTCLGLAHASGSGRLAVRPVDDGAATIAPAHSRETRVATKNASTLRLIGVGGFFSQLPRIATLASALTP